MARRNIVTRYETICIFCGKPAECEQHLVFGWSEREKADEDGLFVPACNKCHNMGSLLSRVHENSMAEKLSKMLGQAMWERNWLLEEMKLKEAERTQKDDAARKAFMKRYGKSYM